MIEPTRIQRLNDRAERGGDFVLYWMQQSQRASFNPALEYAVREANGRDLPVAVVFGVMDDYPEANARHYAFMLQGLQDVGRRLANRRIAFAVRHGAPEKIALDLARDAALLVCDRGYLRHQRKWRENVAGSAPCPVVQIEGDVVVPVDVASDKSEFAARTLRPKILRHRDDYLRSLDDSEVTRDGLGLMLGSDVDLSDISRLLARLDIDHTVGPVKRFTGGTGEARRRLAEFLRNRLPGYGDGRNEPGDWQCSFMSAYLHFGQISPVELARRVQETQGGSRNDRGTYLEELIVRRELAINFVHFAPSYDSYDALPEWARRTLSDHARDRRARIYGREDLEAAETHDPNWNAAMREMVHTGFMHNYMRMYWAKKILEWSATPEQAFATALALNNKYFLDGRDPNSYANVAWCFGLHDRAWTERPVFGKIRYMNDKGLLRKFDMDRYIEAVDRLVAAEKDPD